MRSSLVPLAVSTPKPLNVSPLTLSAAMSLPSTVTSVIDELCVMV